MISGRNYLAPNESLIIGMLKAAIAEPSDTPTKQHLLAALQKLSLRYETVECPCVLYRHFRRSVQTIMINQNTIKWLVPLLNKTETISDYTLGKLSPFLRILFDLLIDRICCCTIDEFMSTY